MAKDTETQISTTIRAAKIRGMIAAYMKDRLEFTSSVEIYHDLKPKLDEMGAARDGLMHQLEGMAENKLIAHRKEGSRNTYASIEAKKRKPKEVAKSTRVDVKIKSLKSGPVPAYKIDVVKGQQRVRITIQDVMFDIGVVTE